MHLATDTVRHAREQTGESNFIQSQRRCVRGTRGERWAGGSRTLPQPRGNTAATLANRLAPIRGNEPVIQPEIIGERVHGAVGQAAAVAGVVEHPWIVIPVLEVPFVHRQDFAVDAIPFRPLDSVVEGVGQVLRQKHDVVAMAILVRQLNRSSGNRLRVSIESPNQFGHGERSKVPHWMVTSSPMANAA